MLWRSWFSHAVILTLNLPDIKLIINEIIKQYILINVLAVNLIYIIDENMRNIFCCRQLIFQGMTRTSVFGSCNIVQFINLHNGEYRKPHELPEIFVMTSSSLSNFK